MIAQVFGHVCCYSNGAHKQAIDSHNARVTTPYIWDILDCTASCYLLNTNRWCVHWTVKLKLTGRKVSDEADDSEDDTSIQEHFVTHAVFLPHGTDWA